MQVDVFEDMNAGRAPPEREIDTAERDRRVRAREVSCMFRCSLVPSIAGGMALPRSYGSRRARVQTFALVVMALALAVAMRPLAAAAADRPVRIVVLGDSLTAGLGLSADQAFPAKLEQALRAKG